MQNSYTCKFHPDFFNDLRKLDKRDLESIDKQIEKIKANPLRFKHLRGGENCYTARIGKLRLVYYILNNIIWFLIAEKRDRVYAIYFKRLYKIKQQLD